jgi:hypothetical protein
VIDDEDVVEQGDVVVDGDGQGMMVISGRGFNSQPGIQTLWTIPVEANGMLHPHLIMSRERGELRAIPLRIGQDGVRRQIAIIQDRILGA